MEHWNGTVRNGACWNVYAGDAHAILSSFEDGSFDCVITSPPYFWLRDYEVEGQLGQEGTVQEYINAITKVMAEVLRVLAPDGLLFLNLGDTYYSGKGQPMGADPKSKKRRMGLRAVDKSGGMSIGLKPKSAIGIPWRVAIEMCQRGWVLRSPIIWHRKSSLPEKVTDRPRRNYEHIFMFAKSRKYYFNQEPLQDWGEEDLWEIPARPAANGINTAPYPDEVVQRCLDIGCKPQGRVLDPFAGSGTTLRVALKSGHCATGIDLNSDFCEYMVTMLRSI